ncbi:jg25807 [Pararge aegeria aegeria]|uniref:Jg25807 protein n=1 Tax=Pararge aegeria aegeria TaxID=348720 RepID=A0A8S4S722_9NEOP|nr:jg25807 [Pararge aegeria aegeria]
MRFVFNEKASIWQWVDITFSFRTEQRSRTEEEEYSSSSSVPGPFPHLVVLGPSVVRMATDVAPRWITPASRARSRNLAGPQVAECLMECCRGAKVCCALFCYSIALEHYVYRFFFRLHACSAERAVSYT